jgi:drug/metabolite transporter (DMT)-like permease
VIYGFAVDLLFFGESFTPMQVVAVLIILSTNIAVSVYKMRKEEKVKA